MSKNCSICLSKRAEKVLDTDEVIIDEERRSYLEIIQFCLGLQVSDVSEINTKLCKKCNNKLVSFYKFKTLALKSLNFMQSLCKEEINKCNETVKQEESLEYQEGTSENDNAFECHTPDFTAEAAIKNEKCDSDDDLLWNVKLSKKGCSPVSVNDFDTTLEPVIKKKNSKVKPKENQSKTKVCEECGKLVSNLEKHLKSHKFPTIKKFICEQCGRSFASNNGRKKHIKSHHLDIRSTCKVCGKSVRELKAHMLMVHNRLELKHSCNICGAKFRNAYALKSHEMTHSTEKLECNLCFKKYSSAYSLNCHKRSIHEKEKCHLCQYCSKTFFKKYHLNEHLRIHSDERMFVCECGKTYKSRSTLVQHRRTHDDCGKLYTCDYCQMTFPLKRRLTAHIITHMKLKPHACRFCSTRFSRTDHRLRHERTAHLKRQDDELLVKSYVHSG